MILNVSITLLNWLLPNFSTLLYHLAKLSFASSGFDFLLYKLISSRYTLYAFCKSENLSKSIYALLVCCSFHFEQCREVLIFI